MALGLVLVACGGPRRVHRPGDEYLGAVQIEGNHAIASDDLFPGLAVARQLEYHVDDYQIALDTTRIAGAYQRLGYFDVKVTPRVDHQADAATVVFTVVEGPRAAMRVELVGLPADIPMATARALIAPADGAPFDYDVYDAAKAPLLQLVEDNGYAHARMEATVIADRANAQATVRYVIDAGPRCTFGEPRVEGVSGALADAVRARVAFHAGQRYSSTAVAATQRAIYGMGRFAAARVDPAKTDATVIPVTIAVSEGKQGELKAGFGLGIDPLTIAPRLRLQITHVGLFDPLTTATFDAKPALAFLRDNCGTTGLTSCQYEPRIRILAGLSRQDLFRRDLKGELEGGLDYLTVEAYTSFGARGRLGLSSPLGVSWLQGRVGWMIADYAFSNIEPAVGPVTAAQLGLDRGERIGAFTASLVADRRDHPLEPTRGFYAEVRVAKGTQYAGSAFDYVQLSPDLRMYLPLGRAVLAGRARLGMITGDIPVTERYYGGGFSGHRGFADRQLSPTSTNIVNGLPQTVVIGGGALFESSLEVRVRAGTLAGLPIGVQLFVDAGDVTDTFDQLDFGNLHYAVGAGLGGLTPIGPIGLYVARRVTRTGTGEPELGHLWNWGFLIGEAF